MVIKKKVLVYLEFWVREYSSFQLFFMIIIERLRSRSPKTYQLMRIIHTLNYMIIIL